MDQIGHWLEETGVHYLGCFLLSQFRTYIKMMIIPLQDQYWIRAPARVRARAVLVRARSMGMIIRCIAIKNTYQPNQHCM